MITERPIYKAKEFAKLIGVTTRTLRRWEIAGTFIPCKFPYPSNRKYYTEDHLKKILGGSADERKEAIS